MLKYFFSYLKTPIGLLRIKAAGQFVVGIDFVSSRAKRSGRANIVSRQAAGQLQEYFSKKRKKFPLPMVISGTEFQTSIWHFLRSVPYGSTISYQDLAAAVGRPKSARAVGQAVNKNPLSIVIPCHRVVGSRGELVGYAGGLGKKKYLLDLERKKG